MVHRRLAAADSLLPSLRPVKLAAAIAVARSAHADNAIEVSTGSALNTPQM